MLKSWWPNNLRLDVDIHSSAVVLADKTGLCQVVLNLLQNAAQACPATNASVRVGLCRDGVASRAVLTVSDTGTGISADAIERIFDPFFTTKSDGHGLGLSVVHGIITSFDGTIDVTSTLGAGTTFTVGVPLFYPQPVVV